MLKRPGRMGVRQSLHERNSQARRTTTRYHHRQRDTIHLRPMEGNYGEIRNRTKTQHGIPPTNRRTDRKDQSILEQYLRAYINYQQDDWSGYLPLAEFAYNNGYQETIKNTPFIANYGINAEYEMIGHLIQGKKTKPEEMSQLDESLRNEMGAAQLRQKEYYHLHRKPDPKLQSGDMVWLLPPNIKTTRPSSKRDYKIIGPFKILAKIGTRAYKLALPPSMAIHNTFHISRLERYQENRFAS